MARDLICSFVLAAIAALYYFFASRIGASALADEVGPAGLPLAYAVLLGAVAVLLAIKTLVGRWLAAETVETVETAAVGASSAPRMAYRLKRAAGALAIGAVYVAIVSFVGYWLALALLIPAVALYQGQTLSRSLIIISVVGASGFWLLFVWLLSIPMPSPWMP